MSKRVIACVEATNKRYISFSLQKYSFYYVNVSKVLVSILLRNQYKAHLSTPSTHFISLLCTKDIFITLFITTDKWPTFSNSCLLSQFHIGWKYYTHFHIWTYMLFHWWQWHLGIESIHSTDQLPVFPWNLRSAKSSQLVLNYVNKQHEVLKIVDIHHMKCVFKTGS